MVELLVDIVKKMMKFRLYGQENRQLLDAILGLKDR